jgi:hypothetical protein
LAFGSSWLPKDIPQGGPNHWVDQLERAKHKGAIPTLENLQTIKRDIHLPS